MIWGLSNGQRITAEPNKKATCDICNEELIAKCGNIKVWHWSHKINSDCDTWGEHETQWHINWKNEFPKEQQEIVVQWLGLKHRADVKLSNGKVIELQNSPISSEEIEDREIFYEDMVWLINGKTLGKGLCLRNKQGFISFRWKNPPKSWWLAKKEIYIDLEIDQNPKYQELIFRKEIVQRELDLKEMYLDGGYCKQMEYDRVNEFYIKLLKEIEEFEKNNICKNIFLIKKIYPKCPCGGWGILLSKEEFLKKVKNGENRTTN